MHRVISHIYFQLYVMKVSLTQFHEMTPLKIIIIKGNQVKYVHKGAPYYFMIPILLFFYAAWQYIFSFGKSNHLE